MENICNYWFKTEFLTFSNSKLNWRFALGGNGLKFE